MRTPTLDHYFEPKIMRIIIEIIRYYVFTTDHKTAFITQID